MRVLKPTDYMGDGLGSLKRVRMHETKMNINNYWMFEH